MAKFKIMISIVLIITIILGFITARMDLLSILEQDDEYLNYYEFDINITTTGNYDYTLYTQLLVVENGPYKISSINEKLKVTGNGSYSIFETGEVGIGLRIIGNGNLQLSARGFDYMPLAFLNWLPTENSTFEHGYNVFGNISNNNTVYLDMSSLIEHLYYFDETEDDLSREQSYSSQKGTVRNGWGSIHHRQGVGGTP